MRALFLIFLASCLGACLPSVATVPVTSANAPKIQTCQDVARLHNAFVVGDFVVGGGATGVGAAGALVSQPDAKNTLAIIGASLGAASAIGITLVGWTSNQYANDDCSSVTSPLSLRGAQ